MSEGVVQRILEAIINPGRNPALHYRMMERHRKEWPTLWAALDELVAEHNQGA